MKYFTEVFEAIARIEEPEERASQHLQTVRSYFEAGYTEGLSVLLDESLQLIHSLRDPQQKLFLLRKMGQNLASMFRFEAALYRLSEMDPLQLDPAVLKSDRFLDDLDEQKNALLAYIAKEQVQSGLLEEALKTAEQISDLDDYEQTLIAIARREDRLDCLAPIGELLENPENLFIIWDHTACLQRLAGNVEEAEKAINKAFEIAIRDITDISKRDVALLQIAKYHLFWQSPAEIWENLFTQIQQPQERCTAQVTSALYHFDRNEIERTHLALDKATREVDKIKDVSQQIAVCKALGQAFAHCRDPENSKRYFNAGIRIASRESNAYSQIRFLSELAESMNGSGFRNNALKILQQVIKVAESVENLYLRCYYLREIVEQMVRNHFVDEALALIEKMDETAVADWEDNSVLSVSEQHSALLHQKSLMFSQTARQLREMGETEDVYSPLMKKAFELARKMDDPIIRAESIRKIAELEHA